MWLLDKTVATFHGHCAHTRPVPNQNTVTVVSILENVLFCIILSANSAPCFRISVTAKFTARRQT